MLRKLWQDDAGFVLSAELVLVLTIAVLAMIVGLSSVAVAINTELNDLSSAFGNISQTYAYTGFKSEEGKNKAMVKGTRWDDATDTCDLTTDCSLICGFATGTTSEKTGVLP